MQSGCERRIRGRFDDASSREIGAHAKNHALAHSHHRVLEVPEAGEGEEDTGADYGAGEDATRVRLVAVDEKYAQVHGHELLGQREDDGEKELGRLGVSFCAETSS